MPEHEKCLPVLSKLPQVCFTQNVSLRLHLSLGFIIDLKSRPSAHAGAPPSRRNDQHASSISMSSAGPSGHITASIARTSEIDCSAHVGSSLHTSDRAHCIMPCPHPTMLVPPSASVYPPGGSLWLEVRSAREADPAEQSSAPGCSGILCRTPESSSRGPSSPPTPHSNPGYGRVQQCVDTTQTVVFERETKLYST